MEDKLSSKLSQDNLTQQIPHGASSSGLNLVGGSSSTFDGDKVGKSLTREELEAVLSYWKGFDLTSNRTNWEKVCNEMREMKTSSISGRKRLNELTKSFRAKKPEEQPTSAFNELLKAYQEEIDQLSRRCKLSESSYVQIYKLLCDAPDPVMVLESSVHTYSEGNVQSYEIERLKAELAQYDEEFQTLKNQEITIRRLEEEINAYKTKGDEKLQEELNKQVSVIQQQANQEILEIKEMSKSMEKRLSLALESAKSAQLASDRAQYQVLEISAKSEERISSLLSENLLLSEEKGALEIKVEEMNKRFQALSSSVSSTAPLLPKKENNSTDSVFVDDTDGITDLSQLKEFYEKLLSQYRSERNDLDDQHAIAIKQYEQQLRESKQLVDKEKDSVRRLREELVGRPSVKDYHEIKKRLKVVEKIAFQQDNEDYDNEKDEQLADAPEHTTPSTLSDRIPLETLLTNKIRTLEKENTEHRKRIVEFSEMEITLKEKLNALSKQLENNKMVTSRLEAELEARNAALEKLASSTSSGSTGGMSANGGNQLTDLAELLGVQETPNSASAASTQSQNNQSSSSIGGEQSSANSGHNAVVSTQMIQMLQTQRDRYKDKLTTAEATILKTQEILESMKASKTQLEEENLALYAKIKFLQTYGGSSSGGSGTVAVAGNKSIKDWSMRSIASGSSNRYNEETRYSDDYYDYRGGNSSGAGRDIESKYASLYEQRMNPFAEFAMHEKQRKLRELSVADRIVLNTTLAIVSNNFGRNFLLIYFGAMHLLVFLTIYYTAHNVHHGCDPGLDNLHHNAAAAAVGLH